MLPAVAALIERNRTAIQEMFSCASRFTTKDAAGINVTVPSSKIGGVGKGLGLGAEVEGQFSFRPAQDLVIPINNRRGEIIPFEEVTRKGTGLVDLKFLVRLLDSGSSRILEHVFVSEGN